MQPKFCYCRGWQENIELLQAYFQFAEEFGKMESIETFRFCPWCGQELMTINDLGEEYGGDSKE